jgi:hypothetical protein
MFEGKPVMNPRAKRLIMLSVLCASAALAGTDSADQPPPDKSGYHLFNPTPDKLMRELTPDRPDKTESPYTVDAGHFQIEMDFANYTRDESAGVRVQAWNVTPINFKVGLFNRADFQLIYDNYVNVRVEDRTATTAATQSGFGDLTARLKINLWGDDGGTTAFGLLPFVKFPVNTGHVGNSLVEGGLILPLAVKLPAGWDMGLETGVSALRNGNDNNRHAEFFNSATFGRDIVGKLGGYVEFFSNVSAERGVGWAGTVDIGFTFDLTENVQVDAGVNFGVTRAADDEEFFAGLTVRF